MRVWILGILCFLAVSSQTSATDYFNKIKWQDKAETEDNDGEGIAEPEKQADQGQPWQNYMSAAKQKWGNMWNKMKAHKGQKGWSALTEKAREWKKSGSEHHWNKDEESDPESAGTEDTKKYMDKHGSRKSHGAGGWKESFGKMKKAYAKVKEHGAKVWENVKNGDMEGAFEDMKDGMSSVKKYWKEKVNGHYWDKKGMTQRMMHYMHKMMGGAWGNMSEEAQESMKELKTKVHHLFKTDGKDMRTHLHNFKKFLKDHEDYENSTLVELKDEFKAFMLEEFEDEQDSFDEVVEWYNTQLEDEKSPAAILLQHMQDFKKKVGDVECDFGKMKEKMVRMMGHLGDMMKKKMHWMASHMGSDAAKMKMVKGAEKMLKDMGVFPEEEMTTGPRTDVCLCV